MSEHSNPGAPAVEAPVPAGTAALRRFHFAGPEPGAGSRVGELVPAGLEAVAGRVAPERTGFGSLTEAFDRVQAIAERRLDRALAAFAPTARELAAAIESLLPAESGGASQSERAGRIAQRLGALGGMLVDPARLGATLAHRRGAPPLPEARRQGLEEAAERLRGFARDRPAPIWVVERGAPWRPNGARVVAVAEPAVAALAIFEQAAAPVVEIARAVRRVRLELEGVFDAERHEPVLAAFDRRSLTAAELATVPPVFVVVDAAALADSAFAPVSRLLRSSRPVQVIAVAGDGEPAGGDERLDVLGFGLGHREAFVHGGSLAAAAGLERGFERALAGLRPGLHRIDVAPEPAVAGFPAATLAAARVAGRAAPLVVRDPDAGSGWAARMDLGGNPDLAGDWPAPTAGSAAFTFADAALLEPSWRAHFLVAGGAEETIPIAEWLDLPPEDAAHRLPSVVAVAPDGSTARLVVSRALARATADAREAWRALGELAGVRPAGAEPALEPARELGEAAGVTAGAAAPPPAADEIEQARARADADVVSRLVGALEELARGGV